MNETQACLEKAKNMMEKVCIHTQTEFAKIRAGRVLPSMLDGVFITHYGTMTPLNQVASISTLDARTLAIKPWEQRLIPAIEKAIFSSKLAVTPQNDGVTIRINIPPLTGEKRKALVKQVRGAAEQGKVAVRNVRKDIKEALKKLKRAGTSSEDAIKIAEEEAQKLTDAYIHQLDQLLTHKETEVLEV